MMHPGQADTGFADEARLVEEVGFQVGFVGLESYFVNEHRLFVL